MRENEELQARRWAREEFGGAALGDERRRARLVSMAAGAAQRPGGRVSEVFLSSAERQGAYDFLESSHVEPAPIAAAIASACAKRCRDLPYVFVPVDGSSLTLVDHAREKDFGVIGSYTQDGRGLKVISAMALTPDGVPLGLAALEWWTRPVKRPRHRHPWTAARKVHEKETQRWLDAVDHSAAAIRNEAPGTRLWFQLDREGDARSILRHLAESGEWFTVRSRSNRRLRTSEGKRYLRDALRTRPIGDYLLEVPAAPNRRSRLACMVTRVVRVTLDLLNPWTKSRFRLPVTVVHVRETGTTPRGEVPLEWTLLTNHPVASVADANLVVHGYSQRWRIEDFHKTWKSGVCGVETTQLRATSHVIKWATLLAAVAMRVERLKHLARTQPETPATVELSAHELRALVLLKRRYKKRNETIPDDTPTIAQATLWIAELGGYTGKSSGGPPGAITIARGLERVLVVAEVVEALEPSRKKR
jgi:hypothetical protein